MIVTLGVSGKPAGGMIWSLECGSTEFASSYLDLANKII